MEWIILYVQIKLVEEIIKAIIFVISLILKIKTNYIWED